MKRVIPCLDVRDGRVVKGVSFGGLRGATLHGHDLDLARAEAHAVPVPVIASGGVGTLEHLADRLTLGEADAALAAGIFHFGTRSIAATKQYLAERGIPVRHALPGEAA